MFADYESVRIKASGIEGTIVDIATIKGENIYTIEGNIKVPAENEDGEIWHLYQCKEDEIETV